MTLRLIPASGSPVEIDSDKAVVGRDPGCDVVVNDNSISRKHARLERWGRNWAVIDQRSANGTFLDGQRVAETVVQTGQELRFGNVAYRVEVDEIAATVLNMPAMSDATVIQPAVNLPRAVVLPPAARPAPPPPAAHPAMPSPVARPAPPPPEAHPPMPPPAARPAVPPPRTHPVPQMTYPPEPAEKGKGPLFWSALGCGAVLLLGLIGFGAIMGAAYYRSMGAVEAARAQLKDIADGDLAAAYARSAGKYQAAHSAAAFAAFVDRHPGLKGNTDSTFNNRSVENDTATLSGTLTHAAGTENVVYNLVKEGEEWKISRIEVDGDEGAAGETSAAEAGRLTIEIVALNKVPQGQTVTVRIDVRVKGFDLRPEGNLFRVDLAEDLETFGPNGKRIDELSRVGLETFNQTLTSATDATATFDTSLTFSKPVPGRYRAVITIRDLVGQESKKHEVPFDLP